MEAFRLHAPYYDLVSLEDAKFGFSVKRNYFNTSFKPAFLLNGEPDDVAVIWVVARDSDKDIISIDLRISCERRSNLLNSEVSTQADANSQIQSDKTLRPLPLEERGKWRYDKSQNTLYSIDGSPTEGIDILNDIFLQHCHTVHPIFRWEFILKAFFQKIRVYFFLMLQNVLIFVTETALTVTIIMRSKHFGEIPKQSALRHSPFTDLDYIIQEPEIKEKGKLFELLVSRGTIVVFSFIVCICSVAWYYGYLNSDYLVSVSNSTVAVAAHCAIAIFILETFFSYLRNPNGKFIPWIKRLLFRLDDKILNAKIESIEPFKFQNRIKSFFAR